jgi:phosphatidylinositol-3-phosphatase
MGVTAFLVAGCSSSPPGSSSHDSSSATLPSKVLVVIEENHSFDQMRANMPFLAALSDRYGYATHWQALTHPSEPNYLAITGGSTFGVTNDALPAVNASHVGNAPSVFSEAESAGRSAATYAESMPAPCAAIDSYPYVARHNPWTYFTADSKTCHEHDLGTASFVEDARRNGLPNVGLLIPNLLHDAHDESLEAADAWLQTQLTPVLASSDFTSGELVIVVTADEDDRHSDNTVLTSVVSAGLSHVVVDATLTHYSLTRFIDQVLRVEPLGAARTAPDMATAFGL